MNFVLSGCVIVAMSLPWPAQYFLGAMFIIIGVFAADKQK
jgi:hypothetical protein